MSPPTITLPKRSTTTTPAPSTSTTSDMTINAFTSANGSLSIGAKAGIVLAVLIVTALILSCILFLMRRKKQARKASMAAAADPSGAPLTRDESNESRMSGVEAFEKRGLYTGGRDHRTGV